MDAVKFIKERKRLCETYEVCGGCPANRASGGCIFSVTNGSTPEEQVKIMETWSATHPRKTRQDVFLEQYPNAKVDINTDVLNIYPCNIEYGMANTKYCNSLSCEDCHREFWLKEIE